MNHLEDLREWLVTKIDGSEETRGDDSLISHFINQIDALPSTESRPVVPGGCINLLQRWMDIYGRSTCDDEAEHQDMDKLEFDTRAWLSFGPYPAELPPSEITEPRGCPTPGACSAVAEIADLKQRLLPQFQGRAQRAEHERDALLEQLIAARSATEETAIGNARYEYLRTLNPRKFAELYNEALMGVYQFDDLVDRYRMKGEPVECGYNRTGSLNEGRYVCTCGARMPNDAEERPE